MMLYIFGAGSRAKTLKGQLQFLYPDVKILAFLVDDMEGNVSEIDGIPVKVLRESIDWDTSATVYIATKGIYHADIQKRLETLGMQHVVPVTVEVDNFFRNEYVKKYMASKNYPFVKIDELSVLDKEYVPRMNAKIYMAKSIYDKPLQTSISLPGYIQPIQVGAALTEERLEPDILTDCEGDNISHKNRQYSELTALYWMWKHSSEDVVGLCHYRRQFVLPEEWQAIMEEQNIDVILPVPTFVPPSIAENYRERHEGDDWDFLIDYLESNYLEDFEVAKKVFADSLYSPCNMFISKREIMQELCEWMFPILVAVEEHGGVKEDVYQNRYPGFISERLLTLFFHRNFDKYKVVYADKTFWS